MTRDEVIALAQECQDVPLDDSTTNIWVLFTEQLEHFAAHVAAAERNKCERLKHAMREAMHLLDQPEPRPHAAFSELLLALNPGLPSAIRARGESK